MFKKLRCIDAANITEHDSPHVEDAAVMSMVLMTQARHHETGQHIIRTQHYVHELELALAGHPPFLNTLDDETIKVICKAAALHDIGKVGVPDRILLKPGPLTPEEFEKMKLHTIYGRDIIMAAKEKMKASEKFLCAALDIALYHHEKWIGDGYPEGLVGESIPLPARLMAVADVYDVLISVRPYKEALPHAEAIRIIADERGAHFDPVIVDALQGVQDKFAAIAARFADI